LLGSRLLKAHILPAVRSPRLLLVDDHELFRQGLKAALEAAADFVVVAEAADARSALEAARTSQPDIAILDVSLPGAGGVALARDLLRYEPSCKIMMLTMHVSEPYVLEAFDAGARGYAIKDQRTTEIIDAIRTVARGEIYLAPRIPRSVLERHQSGSYRLDSGPLGELSVREREVFDLAVRGFTNESIASELGISVKTVETHRARINRKLRVHSTGELVRFAALHGLILRRG
jgi:DNA-binding NarL/FixJ family response regulator